MYFSLSVWSIAFARQTNRIARQTKRILRPLVLGTLFRASSLGSRGATLLCDEPKTHRRQKTENLGFQLKTLNSEHPNEDAPQNHQNLVARTTTRRTLFCINFARSAVGGECCALECLSFLSITRRRSNRESRVVKEER